MRTGFGVKMAMPSARPSFLEEAQTRCGFPAASVHPPSIRAQTTAHDVSIRSSTIDGTDRRNPLGVARRLDADRDGGRQRTGELLHGVAVVGELLLDELAGAGVEHGDLLRARVQITSDQSHDRGLLFRRAVTLGLSERSNSARPFS